MRTVIAHLHIFKNAGTTLDWSLQRSFGDAFLEHRDDAAMTAGGADFLADLVQKQASVKAISSHFLPMPMPDMEDVRLVPIALVRHPLDRLQSVYEFERQQQADTQGARAAKAMDFQDYTRWRLQPDVMPVVRCGQTLFLCGAYPESLPMAMPENLQERSDQCLEQTTLLGTVDQYDALMVQAEMLLRPDVPQLDLAYQRQNSRADSLVSSLEERIANVRERLGELATDFERANQRDFSLYEKVRQRQQAYISSVEDFDSRLMDFRVRCATVQAPTR